MSFFYHEHLIPEEDGQAFDRGWPRLGPHGVTWHWTATRDLSTCRRLIGGEEPERRGEASAHFAVGRDFSEGIDIYVELENRSWHSGKEQLLRWDGRPLRKKEERGWNTTIGIETVHVGFARAEDPFCGPVVAERDWFDAATPLGEPLKVSPWGEEQIEMMIDVGRRVVEAHPHIGPRHHHGHCDLCPTYKTDPLGFPYARVLREIYEDDEIPDIWTPLWTVAGRREALRALGLDPDPGDGDQWTGADRRALQRLQKRAKLPRNDFWTTFVNWAVYDLFIEYGLDWDWDEDEPTETVNLTDVLDLHTFQPSEVKQLVQDYIDFAWARGWREIRIIHGKGIGVQREMVRKLLERDERVLTYGDPPGESGGWGATWVTLKDS